ncbi:MAG: hypothetical protein QHG98_03815 [Methanothrix sp.]|jgi:hypothetical protein|nr:hypothetical protein [Methanothrix sp.]
MTLTGYVLQSVPVGRENARTSRQIYETLRTSGRCIDRRHVTVALRDLWKCGRVRRERVSGVLSHYLYWRDPE